MDERIYKERMVQVAQRLRKDDIEKIKYLFKNEASFEQVNNGLELIKTLEKFGYVGANNLGSFKDTLKNLDRHDLIEILNEDYQPPAISEYFINTYRNSRCLVFL